MAGELTAQEIAELVARYPLREGVPDAVLNRSELAEFFDVSALTITAWVNDGMPVLSKGGQGQAYEFQASACWAWKSARDRAEALRSDAARAAIAAQRLALVGGSVGDSIEALPPKERREILAAQIAHEQWLAARNQLLRRDDVVDMLTAVFAIVRDGLEAMPDRIERVTAIDAKAVAELIVQCDATADAIRLEIERWIAERPEKQQQPKTDLFNAA